MSTHVMSSNDQKFAEDTDNVDLFELGSSQDTSLKCKQLLQRNEVNEAGDKITYSFDEMYESNDSSHVQDSDLQRTPFQHGFDKSKRIHYYGKLENETKVEARPPSQSSSNDSSSSQDTSLASTLASSLKLIAINSTPLSSLQVLSPSDRDFISAETSDSQASVKLTPMVVLSSMSPQQSAPGIPTRRYSTRLSAAKADKSVKRSSLDTAIMKPVPSNDGSITLYQCEKCSKIFNKKQTLRQHFITHTDRFACSFCDTRCKSKGDLHRHIQTHTKEKPFHCDVCNTDYTRETILRKHMKTQIHLRACYEKQSMDRLHKLIENGDTSPDSASTRVQNQIGFSCHRCSRVLLSKSDYKKHQKSHALKHICDICKKACRSLILLRIHQRCHSRSLKLFCQVCARSFASKYTMKEHMKLHKSNRRLQKEVEDSQIHLSLSSPVNTDTAPINKDDVSSTSQPPILDNSSILSKGSKLECEECGKLFTSQKRLENHIRLHSETYMCGNCRKVFSSMSKLKIHLKLHARTLKCESCDLSFPSEKELLDHIQEQHTANSSNFTCKLCYQNFDTTGNLQKHMRNHAPTMLFSGKSLDDAGTANMGTARKRSAGVGAENVEINKGDRRDTNEAQQNTDKTKRLEPEKQGESVDESFFETGEFFEAMKSILDDSDDSSSEYSDSDEELFSDVMAAISNGEVASISNGEDIMAAINHGENIMAAIVNSDTSSESDNDDLCKGDSFLDKSKLLEGGEAPAETLDMELSRLMDRDEGKQVFKCQLCDASFREEKHIESHVRGHQCEYCNKFVVGRDKLTAHKSRHMKYLLKQIKTRMCGTDASKPSWEKTNSSVLLSSESDNDLEDQFLNELEDILEGEPPKVPRSINFLHSLSHDEIVRANKHIFEQYSCLDLSNNIFACTICKRKYARPTTLTRHFKTHVCQFCNKFFEDKSDLLEHKYKHRKRAALMKAEITGVGSKMPPSPLVSKPNRDMFKRYSFTDSERNINRCTLCCKDFVRRTVLTRHMKTHICSHCDKFFEDKYDLAKHVTYHQVEKQYLEEDEFTEYDEEEKQYSANSSLVGHLDHEDKNIAMNSSFPTAIRHLNPSFHQPTACSTRNGTITFIQIPNGDSADANGAQVYTTPGNGSSSYQLISQPLEVYKDGTPQSFLVASTPCPGNEAEKIITISQPQMVTGSDERERLFECGECGKRFFKNGHLRSHMTIHTGDRPYRCRLCGKAFGRGTTLRKHEKTHMKRCKICDTSFSQKYELDLHMEIHRTYAFYK